MSQFKEALGLAASGESKNDCLGEESATDQLSSSNLFENMEIMVLLASVMSLIILLLGLCLVIGKNSQCVQKVAQFIKKKLFYNFFLRYVL